MAIIAYAYWFLAGVLVGIDVSVFGYGILSAKTGRL